MARNSASRIFFTHAWNGTSHNIEFYCQHHTQYDQKQHSGLPAASLVLKAHIEENHGLVEQ